MKVRAHHILILAAMVSVVLLAWMVSWIKDDVRDTYREDVGEALETASYAAVQAIDNWLDQRRAAVQIWADTPEIRQLTSELLELPRDSDTLTHARIRERLRAWLYPLQARSGNTGYLIVSDDGVVYASNRESDIGRRDLLQRRNDLVHKLRDTGVAVSMPELADDSDIVSLETDDPTIYFGAPILDKSGQFLAALILRVDPAEGFTDSLRVGYIGVTGESYAFNRQARMISDGRFSEQMREIGLLGPEESTILNVRLTDPGVDLTKGTRSGLAVGEQPLTFMAANAIGGHAGTNLEGYRGYRGVKVVGTWVFDSELGIGIATEVDAQEVYKSLYAIENVITVLTVLSVLLLTGLAVLLTVDARRRQVQKALTESESRIRLLLDSVDDGVFGVDPEGTCTFVNSVALGLLGFGKGSELVGRKIGDIVLHTPHEGTETEDVTRYLVEAIQKGKPVRLEDGVMWRHDGLSFDVECHCSPVYLDGKVAGAVASFRDITQRHRAEERLRQAATVFENTDQGIIVADAGRQIVAVNRAFTEITGYSADEVVGRNPSLLQSGQHDRAFYTRLWRTLNRTRQWRGEIWNRRKNGEMYPAWQSISLVTDDSGRLSNYIAIFSDISALKASEQRLDHLAHHDALTGLPNRLLLDAKLDQILELAKRNRNKVALLFLDLDRFKLINDTMGHSHGDELLRTIAERLKGSVRAEDTVARLGGDEFVIVLAEIKRSGDAAVLAEKILKAVSTPVRLGGQEIVTSTSIGISLFPDDGDNHADLLKTADAAMYHAKESGRQNYRFYTFDLTEKAHAHLSIERGLRAALARGEFVLHYQPQVYLFDGHITGVEALIRWQHPTKGLLPPAGFIPVAEETELIDLIGEWVLRKAGADARKWRDAGLSSVRVGVNLSGRQFRSQSSLDRIVAILEELNLQPGEMQLDLEVTESTLQTAEGSLEALGRMKSLGATLAIDDFGTGHSSLHRLKHLPIDTLKIDRSFVKDIPSDPDDEAIAEAIIAMGHSLHLKVIAEGVETAAQLGFLRASGCDEMQGFLFSRPVPADRIAQLLVENVTLEFYDDARVV